MTSIRILTVREVADRLGVSKSLLDKLRYKTPALSPPHIKIGGKIGYPEAALVDWVTRNTVTSEVGDDRR